MSAADIKTVEAESLASQSASVYQNPRTRYYVLGVLTLVYSFNFIDRQLLSILQESVKRDLSLSDGQLGLLTGFAFAMFYVVAGLPIARWADRSNRRNIVAASLATWSLMTAVCGMAQTYLQLLLARAGVGIGEAGGSPPSHSMISDIFTIESRATALAIYSVGINIGILFGFLLGGWLNQELGWRMAFLVVGLPGILLAILVRYTVAEPLRGYVAGVAKPTSAVPFGNVVRLLWSRKAFRHIAFGAGLTAFCGYGVANWIASFMIRTHHMATAELGVWLALSIGVGGGIGTFCSGMIADRLGRRDRRWYVWFPALAGLTSMPFFVWMMKTDSASAALTINVAVSMAANAFLGPSIAVMHGMVGSRMRAVSSAIFFLVLNIIGLGLGPFSIGVYSDYLTQEYGTEALRHSMATLIPFVGVWAAIHYLLAAKTLREDMAAAPD